MPLAVPRIGNDLFDCRASDTVYCGAKVSVQVFVIGDLGCEGVGILCQGFENFPELLSRREGYGSVTCVVTHPRTKKTNKL